MQPRYYREEHDPAIPRYDDKLEYSDREHMELAGYSSISRRKVHPWVNDNKKLCAVILEELACMGGRRYRNLIRGHERDWLEAHVQAVRGGREWKVYCLSEVLAYLLWNYYRLRKPMSEVADALHCMPLMLHVKLRRLNRHARRLFPADCLPKQKPKTRHAKYGDEIVALRALGLSWTEIARRVGGTLSGVSTAYQRLTAKRYQPKYDGALVYEMRKAGLGFKRIAKRLGVGSSDGAKHAYRQYLKRTGMPDLPRPKCFAANRCIDVQRVQALRSAGLSWTQISKAAGWSPMGSWHSFQRAKQAREMSCDPT
jgi:hypothetical protein